MCKIIFNIDRPLDAVIKIVDIIGREYDVRETSYERSGEHEIDFKSVNVPPGFYFYHIYDKNIPHRNNPHELTEVATGSVQVNMEQIFI